MTVQSILNFFGYVALFMQAIGILFGATAIGLLSGVIYYFLNKKK